MFTQEQEVANRMGSSMARYRIKEAAAEQNISLKTIATRSRLSETRLRDVANNRVPNVTVRFLEIVAHTIGVPLGDIFERESLESIPELPDGITPASAR